MGYTLKLRQSDDVALPRAAVRALLGAADANAALLYLYLAERTAAEDAEVCRALHWDKAALQAAEERLETLGLLG